MDLLRVAFNVDEASKDVCLMLIYKSDKLLKRK